MSNRRASGLKTNTVNLGSELIVNGDFATDTVWNKLGGSTIAGGEGTFNPIGASYFIQVIFPLTVKTYQVELDIIYVSNNGEIQFAGGNSAFGNQLVYKSVGINENVHLKFNDTTNGTQSGFQLYSPTSGTLIIDNVSVKEVLP